MKVLNKVVYQTGLFYLRLLRFIRAIKVENPLFITVRPLVHIHSKSHVAFSRQSFDTLWQQCAFVSHFNVMAVKLNPSLLIGYF